MIPTAVPSRYATGDRSDDARQDARLEVFGEVKPSPRESAVDPVVIITIWNCGPVASLTIKAGYVEAFVEQIRAAECFASEKAIAAKASALTP